MQNRFQDPTDIALNQVSDKLTNENSNVRKSNRISNKRNNPDISTSDDDQIENQKKSVSHSSLQYIEKSFIELASSLIKTELNNQTKLLQKNIGHQGKKIIAFQWPTNQKKLSFYISDMDDDKKSPMILIYDEDKDEQKLLLHLKVIKQKKQNELQILKMELLPAWKITDIYDLVNVFAYFFQANIDNQTKFEISQDPGNLVRINFNQPLDWFESEYEFRTYCLSINKQLFSIPQFLLNHSTFKNGTNTFWIKWDQKKDPDYERNFKICFSPIKFSEKPKKGMYHSWCFAEKDFLLKLHNYAIPPSTLEYHRIMVFEHLSPKDKVSSPSKKVQETLILDIWESADQKFGELYAVQKGILTTGTEAMRLSDYLNTYLLHIIMFYICDSARTNGAKLERDEDNIVLRVLMLIAYGQTWYEQFGFEAFSFNDFNHGWAKSTELLSQDLNAFQKARDSLAQFNLFDLYISLIQEEKKYSDITSHTKFKDKPSMMLYYLFCKYIMNTTLDNFETELKKHTLRELSAKVYDAFKVKTSETYDTDLKKMYSLMVVPDRYIKPKNTKPTDVPGYYQLLTKIVDTTFFRKPFKPVLDPGKAEYQLEIEKKTTQTQCIIKNNL